MLPRNEPDPYHPHVLRVGMLEFTEETAHHWAGPFEGGYAAYKLMDYRIFSRFSGPEFLRLNDLSIQEKMRKREQLKHLSKKERLAHYWIFSDEVDFPTTEKPIRLYVYGNDDTSFSKFYATTEEAVAELNLLEGCGALDFNKDFLALGGFVFTN